MSRLRFRSAGLVLPVDNVSRARGLTVGRIVDRLNQRPSAAIANQPTDEDLPSTERREEITGRVRLQLRAYERQPIEDGDPITEFDDAPSSTIQTVIASGRATRRYRDG